MSPEPTNMLGARLKEVAREVGGVDELARLTGTARRTLGNYISGRNEPKMSFLLAVSSLPGVSLDWLISGKREQPPVSSPDPRLDEELLGRITDAIARTYKDERVSIAPIDLGRLSGRKYAEIVAATEVHDERLAMIKLVATQLRADLRSAAEEPGTGKRSA